MLNIVSPRIRWRTIVPLSGLGILLALSAWGLAQCRPVGDAITELDLSTSDPSSARHKRCTMRCDSLHTEAKVAERARHRTAIRACGEDLECRKAEHRLCRENKRHIESDKKAASAPATTRAQ
jgi:hypothetical protein